VLPRSVLMQLSFYQIPTKLTDILLAQNINVYFYDISADERQIVDSESLPTQMELTFFPPRGHFQILISDIDLIQDSSQVIDIIEYNRELLLYVDRFNSRLEKYKTFYRPQWNYLLELSNAIKTGEFLSLACTIQADISHDPQNISIFASTISDCLEKVLRRDSNLSRMLCFSYCCFKHMAFTDRSLLYDFLGAVMFKDLGLSQNQSKNIFEKNTIYFKHPYYSLFLLKKLPIELTQTCYFFILDHHESQDGTGFPKQKMGTHYHSLCDVLKTTENLFLHNSTKYGYKSELLKLKERGDVLNDAFVDCLRIICSYLTG
jgi:hypothetical protein